MEKWMPRILVTDKEKQQIFYFARMFNIHPITAFLIYAREHRTLESIRRFLYPSFLSFSNPFLMQDMERGVERVSKALLNGETIAIFGDYDADGITSTSMLAKALSFCNGKVISRLPLRSEGYGLNKEAVSDFKRQGVSLIVTVDNGSSCHDEIAYAQTLGIDVVVTDHHDILHGKPPAFAFINPKREDDTSGLSYLAGAGVTLYFIRALFSKRFLPWDLYIYEYIELATIGTICDMVPLINENRILCKMGLKKMNHNPSPILSRLKKLLYINHLDSNAISFDIGPLLNGFGRYDDPNQLIPLFASQKSDDWFELKCQSMQTKRKKIGREQTLLAEKLIESQHIDQFDILHIHGDFHEGILGILASKLAKKHKKPTLISCLNGKGSARSIPNSDFSIVDVLQTQSHFLEKYGGHAFAAGFTLKKKDVFDFSSALQKIKLEPRLLRQIVPYDMELSLQEMPDTLYGEMHFLEPFGTANPKPVFRMNQVRFNNVVCFGKHDMHIKSYLDDATFLSFFAKHEDLAQMNFHPLDILYSPLKKSEFLIESKQARHHVQNISTNELYEMI